MKRASIPIRCMNQRTGREETHKFSLYNNSQVNLKEILEAFVGTSASLSTHSIFKSCDGISLVRLSPNKLTALSEEKFMPDSLVQIEITTRAEDPERKAWPQTAAKITNYAKIISELLRGNPKPFIDLDGTKIWQDNKTIVQKVLNGGFAFEEKYADSLKDYESVKFKGDATEAAKKKYLREVWGKLRNYDVICVKALGCLVEHLEMRDHLKEKLLENLTVFIHLNISMYPDTYFALLFQTKHLMTKLSKRHMIQEGAEEIKFVSNWAISLMNKLSERCLAEKQKENYSQTLFYPEIIKTLSSLFWYFTIIYSKSNSISPDTLNNIPHIFKVVKAFSDSSPKTLAAMINDNAEMLSIVFWHVLSSLNTKSLPFHAEYIAGEIWEPLEKIVTGNFKAYLKAVCEGDGMSRKSSNLTEKAMETPGEGYKDQVEAILPFHLLPKLSDYLYVQILDTAKNAVDSFHTNYLLLGALKAYYILRAHFAINALDETYAVGSAEHLAAKKNLFELIFAGLEQRFVKGDECLRNVHLLSQLNVLSLSWRYFAPVVEDNRKYNETLIKIIGIRSHECFSAAYEVWKKLFPYTLPNVVFAYISDYKKANISAILQVNKEGKVNILEVLEQETELGENEKEYKVQIGYCGGKKKEQYSFNHKADFLLKYERGKTIEITPIKDAKHKIKDKSLDKAEKQNAVNLIETTVKESELAELYRNLLKVYN